MNSQYVSIANYQLRFDGKAGLCPLLSFYLSVGLKFQGLTVVGH